ncbi:hypothetical protein [Hyphomicrobium sp. CS1GBMeth3]|uniref:hypothetical protein n=1 Tax=Hyphomicrobium sp. CS1GBMeth3 TaxID=1892845 RepID=UPI000AA7470A|nr:hypothetical protein [Hyphomicrobium sp. CS1GBMeth3]
MTHTGSRRIPGLVLALGVAALLITAATPPAVADDDSPRQPRIDCTKPKNKTKEACKPHHSASDDEIINGAYWLANTGDNTEALGPARGGEGRQ